MRLWGIGHGMLSVLRSRALWVIVMSAVFCGTFLHIMMRTRYVTIYDFEGQGLIHFETESTDLGTLLEEGGVELGQYDEVSFTGPGRVMEIEIDRAYPVYVAADGVISRVYVTDATVAEAVALCGVELGVYDRLSMPLERPMSAGEKVDVTRVAYHDSNYTEPIGYSVEYVKTSLLRTGAKRVRTQGSAGEKMVFLRDMYVDGELVSSYVQNELTTVEPVNTLALLGEAGYAISPYEPFEGVETDENGRPTNAVEVHTNVRTVSYYTGRTCASGLPAQVGHIGVNPSVYPYGTRLYIESEDGSFVYGYCIAADCGPGTLNGTIDIDLFLDTYYECSLLGRRNDMVVYVLPDAE